MQDDEITKFKRIIFFIVIFSLYFGELHKSRHTQKIHGIFISHAPDRNVSKIEIFQPN